ncbi:MAG: hypothetical protein Q8O19_00925, partial [Rectinemataceae bacterium]|nr:hypothetical protein [Rectinemataceae bacterium]
VGVLSSVVAAFYYLKIVKVMYFDEALESPEVSTGYSGKLLLLLTVFVNLAFFMYPALLLDAAVVAASALFQ